MKRFILIAALLSLHAQADAMITLQKGNAPVHDRNWPAGALAVANLKTRLGSWEGPPFGGGQTQFDYRGDAKALQEALDLFGKIQWPGITVHLHEGPHGDAALNEKAVDWTFIVWDPRSWNQLYNKPDNFFSSRDPSGRFRKSIEPPRLDVYLAGPDGNGIDLAAIKIPANVIVADHRATSAGFDRADGSVVRVAVYDAINSKPLENAEVRLEKSSAKTWDVVASEPADASGKVTLKKIPAGSYRVIAIAQGRATRMLGYVSLGANAIEEFTSQLGPECTVSGVVTMPSGTPLGGVKVRAESTMGVDSNGYLLASDVSDVTDGGGRFELTGLPSGYLQIMASDESHQQLEILKLYSAPAKEVTLQMTATGTVKGIVLKPDGSPAADTNVSVNPPGERIGKWGGSMKVKPDGSFEFQNVPPGPYFISTNPGLAVLGKDPTATKIEVKAGETLELKLTKSGR